MLKRLIYGSQAIEANSTNLREILTVSRTRNPEAGITGALCLLDAVYLQYLEGDELAVEALYARIEADARHRAPVVLDRTFIAVRQFPEWSMALVKRDERIRALMGFHGLQLPSITDGDIAHRHAAAFFRALATTPNWVPL
ncbi:BLUF domain-containing protein [Variovorax sp. RCC_210]|uniref:BLUF domain-containing protein n=1 Tax=Variovorax sp. RCC_210 TaxID=3239217 RepID=UPI000D5D517C